MRLLPVCGQAEEQYWMSRFYNKKPQICSLKLPRLCLTNKLNHRPGMNLVSTDWVYKLQPSLINLFLLRFAVFNARLSLLVNFVADLYFSYNHITIIVPLKATQSCFNYNCWYVKASQYWRLIAGNHYSIMLISTNDYSSIGPFPYFSKF